MAILPDVLQPELTLVFCGTAPSHRSAQAQAYYAHKGNLFWPTLWQAGFIPVPLVPAQYPDLPRYGIGLTDLNKQQSGVDKVLDLAAFDVVGLQEKIQQYQPRILAFTSKHGASVFFQAKMLEYGEQAARFGKTRIWVLPSTSGSARSHWQRLQGHWYALAEVYREMRGA